MAGNINTSLLKSSSTLPTPEGKAMIAVENVSMMFNIADAQLNSLKEYAIALTKRELRFKEFWALNDISFEVEKGDVFGILGTNGSGKSTLLKIIAGVLNPTKGKCEVAGNIAPLIELGAGFDMELTARENIYLNGALLGYSKAFINAHFDEIVEFAEIEQFLDMPMKNYSSGMVARVAFAIATVIVPEVLIVDEVLAVGDFMFRQKCERRISELIKDHGVTVLIVSHSNDQIKRLCNKAIWVEKGHTRMIGSAEDVCNTYELVGGRLGSAESEELILELLGDSVDTHLIERRTVVGDSKYGTCVKLSSVVSGGETILVTSGESAPENFLATSLSGLLRAKIMVTGAESVPDIVLHSVSLAQPKRLLFVGDSAHLKPHAVLSELPFDCSVEVLASSDLGELSLEVYEYGAKHGHWGSTALIAPSFCVGDMLAISPAVYDMKIPVFFNDSADAINPNVLRVLNQGFDRLLVLAGQGSLPDELFEPLVHDGVKLKRFLGENEYAACSKILDWIMEEWSGRDVDSLTVVSSKHPDDALTIGPFAASTNSPVVLNDPRQLDSVANAAKLIKKFNGAIDSLCFVGDETIFTELDKNLLCKVAAKSKSENR